MKDYLTIKEFSKLSGIEPTTLRYWDDIGLFSPAKRGEDNKYRYYSPQQMITINFINVLSNLEIQLKTISEMEDRTPSLILRLIRKHERVLDQEMRKLQESYSVIHTRESLINFGMEVIKGFYVKDGVRVLNDSSKEGCSFVSVDTVTLLNREEMPYILGPANDFSGKESFYGVFMNFCKKAEELSINLNFPIGAIHTSMDSFLESPSNPDYFISLDPSGNRKSGAASYLCAFEYGYYGDFKKLPERMAVYAKENQLKLKGPVYTIYLLDEISVKDPSEYLVQVAIEVE